MPSLIDQNSLICVDETREHSYFTSLKKLIYTADFTRKLQFLVRSLEKNRFIFQAKTEMSDALTIIAHYHIIHFIYPTSKIIFHEIDATLLIWLDTNLKTLCDCIPL